MERRWVFKSKINIIKDPYGISDIYIKPYSIKNISINVLGHIKYHVLMYAVIYQKLVLDLARNRSFGMVSSICYWRQRLRIVSLIYLDLEKTVGGHESRESLKKIHKVIYERIVEQKIGLGRTVSSFNFVELESAMPSISPHVFLPSQQASMIRLCSIPALLTKASYCEANSQESETINEGEPSYISTQTIENDDEERERDFEESKVSLKCVFAVFDRNSKMRNAQSSTVVVVVFYYY